MTISRTRFYKWLYAFCVFNWSVQPEEGKDMTGRWIMIKQKDETTDQEVIPF